jgi:hypothetical protein
MTKAQLKDRHDELTDKLASMRALLEQGYAIGDAEAYVTRAEILAVSEQRYEVWVDWSCFVEEAA